MTPAAFSPGTSTGLRDGQRGCAVTSIILLIEKENPEPFPYGMAGPRVDRSGAKVKALGSRGSAGARAPTRVGPKGPSVGCGPYGPAAATVTGSSPSAQAFLPRDFPCPASSSACHKVVADERGVAIWPGENTGVEITAHNQCVQGSPNSMMRERLTFPPPLPFASHIADRRGDKDFKIRFVARREGRICRFLRGVTIARRQPSDGLRTAGKTNHGTGLGNRFPSEGEPLATASVVRRRAKREPVRRQRVGWVRPDLSLEANIRIRQTSVS